LVESGHKRNGSFSIVMVLAKIREKSQVVMGLVRILMEDGLKISLERLKLVMPYMLKCGTYT
jgi:hypothetical protein